MKSIFALSKFVFCLGCTIVASGCNFVSTDNLNQAIATGETGTVQRVIARGVDVNGRGMHAMTPLMTAAKAGRIDICELLVGHGADVNGHNDSGSVLMWVESLVLRNCPKVRQRQRKDVNPSMAISCDE